jgi:hypothetical protein
MSKIKIEAFFSSPPEPNDDNLLHLLNEIGQEYADKVETLFYSDRNDLYEEYNINALPALVIEELMKFVGFCPDKESVIMALQESGLD